LILKSAWSLPSSMACARCNFISARCLSVIRAECVGIQAVQLYQGKPELRAAMSDLLQQARMGKSIAPGALNVAYNRSEKAPAPQKVSGKTSPYPSEKALANTPVPPMEVYDARRLDIPTYCSIEGYYWRVLTAPYMAAKGHHPVDF
jgi:hypothetical protein